MTRINLKCTSLIAALGIIVSLGVPAAAQQYRDPQVTEYSGGGEISASEAKRMVRRFLTERGYSRQLRPGGAQIDEVTLNGNIWTIAVRLRGASITSVEKRFVYIDNRSGLVSEFRPKSDTMLAENAISQK